MAPLTLVLASLLLCAPGAFGRRRLRPAEAANVADADVAALSRPSYVECQDSSECEDDHCCAIGGDRYSIPSCRSVREVGDTCRPNGHKPFNTTVGYPDNSLVELHVFWLFCPCAEGLYCERESHSCQPRP